MDVYQKVLLKIYEATGGKDTEDVDLADLLKREGFYPSLPSILERLSGQSWVTETSRKNVIRITHWGAMEAKKVSASGGPPPAAAPGVKKEIDRLHSQARELAALLENFAADSSKENLAQIERKAAELSAGISGLKKDV